MWHFPSVYYLIGLITGKRIYWDFFEGIPTDLALLEPFFAIRLGSVWIFKDSCGFSAEYVQRIFEKNLQTTPAESLKMSPNARKR